VRAISTSSAPVALRYSRGEIDVPRDACEKLLRRVRHLEAAQDLIVKVDTANGSGAVQLTKHEKGFLVVAIKAWMEDVGSNRVPAEVLRLRQTLLGDLYYPVETVEAAPKAAEPSATPVPAPAAAPEPSRPDARVVRVRRALDRQLKALEALDDERLETARGRRGRCRPREVDEPLI
jgi:hypothetical protein